MRIVFFGTPEFAVPTLEALAREHEIALVVAQPDRPAGRGMQVHVPAVVERARAHGIPVAQPPKIRNPQFLDTVSALHPDAGVVIAYGKILPAALLAIPKHGFFNVHASILPKYRGAAPIQRAVAAGERTTGVTIMRVDEDLDHGPILEIATLDISPDERAPSLSGRLAELGGPLLMRSLEAVARGTAIEREQDHAAATFAPKIEKGEGAIDWTAPAGVIYDRFRAFDPWPGAFFVTHGETIKVTEMHPASTGDAGEPGTIAAIGSRTVDVRAGEGFVRLIEIQRPGKARASAADVARGLRWAAGDRL